MVEGLTYYNGLNKKLQDEIRDYEKLMDKLYQGIKTYSTNKDIHYSKNGFYIYKFLDKENNVLYIGRTVNLSGRFQDHHALTTDVVKIQYIKCNTYADTLWKEIYYINLYKNDKMLNETDISYTDNVTEQDFGDVWHDYDMLEIGKYKPSFRSNPLLEYKHILVKLNSCINKVYNIFKSDNICTNITYTDLKDFCQMILTYDFDESKDYYTLEGIYEAGDVHNTFTYDQEKLDALVIQLFYKEKREKV